MIPRLLEKYFKRCYSRHLTNKSVSEMQHTFEQIKKALEQFSCTGAKKLDGHWYAETPNGEQVKLTGRDADILEAIEVCNQNISQPIAGGRPERVLILEGALSLLLATKDYKDKTGKDANYEKMRIAAWEGARDAIKPEYVGNAKILPSDDGFIHVVFGPSETTKSLIG